MPPVETLPDSLEAADKALETGEVPAAPSPEPAPAAPPAPAPAAQPRDEQGRFASPPPPEPEAPKAGEPIAPPETPGEPAAEESPAWSFRAEGGDFGLEGSLRGEDGVFIPEAQRDRAEQLLRQGLAFEGSSQRWFNDANQRQQQLEQRATAAENRIQAAEDEKQHVLGHFEQLIEASTAQIAQGIALHETPVGQWLLNAAVNWPVLKAEAKAKGIERKYQADTQALETLRREREEADLQPVMLETLGEWVLQYGQVAGLERPVLEQIYQDLQQPRFRSQLFVRAPQDDRRAGIRKGDLVIDHGVVEQEVQRVARWLKASGGTKPAPTGVVPKPAPAKAPPPPPTVSATRGPSPRKPLPEPKTREEADRLLEEGGYDID